MRDYLKWMLPAVGVVVVFFVGFLLAGHYHPQWFQQTTLQAHCLVTTEPHGWFSSRVVSKICG